MNLPSFLSQVAIKVWHAHEGYTHLDLHLPTTEKSLISAWNDTHQLRLNPWAPLSYRARKKSCEGTAIDPETMDHKAAAFPKIPVVKGEMDLWELTFTKFSKITGQIRIGWNSEPGGHVHSVVLLT